MGIVHVSADTDLAPDEVLDAAHDFTSRRAELWPDVHVRHLHVHGGGERWIDVTEGNREPFGYVWERLHYDWSRPGVLRAVVVDSNIFQVGSTWELRATANADGGSHVEIHAERHVTGVKGAIIGMYIHTGVARSVVRSHLEHFLAAATRRARTARDRVGA